MKQDKNTYSLTWYKKTYTRKWTMSHDKIIEIHKKLKDYDKMIKAIQFDKNNIFKEYWITRSNYYYRLDYLLSNWLLEKE